MTSFQLIPSCMRAFTNLTWLYVMDSASGNSCSWLACFAPAVGCRDRACSSTVSCERMYLKSVRPTDCSMGQ